MAFYAACQRHMMVQVLGKEYIFYLFCSEKLQIEANIISLYCLRRRIYSPKLRLGPRLAKTRTKTPSIESVVASSFVPSDFLVDGQVSGLGTVHPLLTLSFVSTWILPLHVVSSTLKRKSSSSVMDGLQRRKKKDSPRQIQCNWTRIYLHFVG